MAKKITKKQRKFQRQQARMLKKQQEVKKPGEGVSLTKKKPPTPVEQLVRRDIELRTGEIEARRKRIKERVRLGYSGQGDAGTSTK